MKKILITGASGFVGRQLLPYLQKTYQVYATSRNKNLNRNNLRWIKMDFAKDWRYSKLPSQVDTVMHLSQSEKFRDFPESSNEIFFVNTVSTLKLLDYARLAKAKKFIYISSGGVQNFHKNISDINFYLTSKFSSELLVNSYKTFFDTIIIRPFFIYGPGSKNTLLIPRLINLIRTNKPICLEGKEGLRINPIYIKDAVKAIAKSMELKGNHTIDLAGNEILSIRQIAIIIGKQLKIIPSFKAIKSKKTGLIGNNLQTSRVLAKSEVKFKDGIKELLKEYE